METTTVAVVGAGPGGMLVAYLLARQGIEVTLLESQADFDRKFRGDTFHSSSLDVMDDLGLADEVEAMCHSKLTELRLITDERTLRMVQLHKLPSKYRYVGLIPQATFLSWLADKARAFEAFELRLESPVRELIREGERVVGVRYKGGDGELRELRAELVIGADGRGSKVRKEAGIELVGGSPPMDLIWFELPKGAGDEQIDPLAVRFSGGHMLICVDRGDFWQMGYVIVKGELKDVREAGIEAFARELTRLLPPLAERPAQTLRDWKQTATLSVKTGRVERWWQPGLLLIGDAAHVMSPVGGVGINYALMDAVAAANRLIDPLRAGTLSDRQLAAVQRRREWPTRVIQWVQAMIQSRVIKLALAEKDFRLPLPLRIINAIPLLDRLPAIVIGRGLRCERVRHRDPA